MTSSKKCKKCEETKAIIDFYEHPKMADGHLNICKECTKKRVGKHRTNNIERIREYDRTRGKEKERRTTRFPEQFDPVYWKRNRALFAEPPSLMLITNRTTARLMLFGFVSRITRSDIKKWL